jgi:Fur family ferric uptake transcriptional regulator
LSCEAESAQVLRESGHKPTPQRLMILTTLRHRGGHMTASQICERVRETYPYVDISTVYRTLGVLKEMRLVAETDMGTGDNAYEWIRPKRHHHLICRNCDRVISIDHTCLEELGAHLLEEHDFLADLDHFAIFGLCRQCAQEAQRKGL